MARWIGLVLAAMASVACPPPVISQGFTATVLSIGDGDTIRVRQAGRAVTVRLACIDAPETAQSPWGQQARRYLQQRLALGRQVRLDVKTTDRYGRTVAEVISDSNIGLAMVEETVVRTSFSRDYSQSIAENEARSLPHEVGWRASLRARSCEAARHR